MHTSISGVSPEVDTFTSGTGGLMVILGREVLTLQQTKKPIQTCGTLKCPD